MPLTPRGSAGVRALAISALTVLLVAATAGPAHAGALLDLKVKRQSTDYADGIGFPLGVGKTRELRIKATLTGSDSDEVLLSQISVTPSSYKAKYFRKGTNITDDVTGDGRAFKLADGEHKVFEMKVKRKDASPASACYLIEADSVDLPIPNDVAAIEINPPICS